MVDDSENRPETLDEARAAVARALESAGGDDPVKPGAAGYAIELRFNGETIALAGQAVTRLAPEELDRFAADQARAIEAGEADDAIEGALKLDGPRKALARVRAIDS